MKSKSRLPASLRLSNIATTPINSDGDRVEQGERLRVFRQDRSERACDNISKAVGRLPDTTGPSAPTTSADPSRLPGLIPQRHFRDTTLRKEHYRIYITRVADFIPAGPDRWIQLTSGEYHDDKQQFSPDGNTMYFTSNRDGFTFDGAAAGATWLRRMQQL